MNNNWSLKGKKFMVDDGYAMLSKHDVKDDECGLFDSDDIETLRKKLIEDFTGIGCPPLPKKVAEEIINKRFGVETK